MSIIKLVPLSFFTSLCCTLILFSHEAFATEEQESNLVLEEIIVTAQKREQSLQDAPIAISVLGADQLEALNINGIGALAEGAIPSLRVQALGASSSNLGLSIRGNAPVDSAEFTREASVAVYLDGIYLGRTHGLNMEFADLQRIEVLRGPQGTLFGRNAVGGAVNLITASPSGEFDIKQTLGVGEYNEFKSLTRINLPEFSGVSVKFDYLHTERDGWVENTAPGESDFAEYKRDGGRLGIHWQVNDSFSFDYAYDQSMDETSQNYFQFYEDNMGLFGAERDRRSQTRRDVTSFEPTVVDQNGHTLTATWNLSEHLIFKSLSSRRDLEEDVTNNFAGVLYYNGLNFSSISDHKQFSQEFQFIGTNDRLDWVSGLYYYDEDVQHAQQNYFTLDIFGFVTGEAMSAIDPPTTFDALLLNAISPQRSVNADAKSTAIYGQATWTPEVLSDHLHLTTGLRYTEEERSGTRFENALRTFSLDTEHTDFTVAVDYEWSGNLSTYFKWTTAYKGAGVHSKSASFVPYDKEEAKTYEIGFKSEFLNRQARLNAALFTTDYDGMQLDFPDPVIITDVETINAEKTVEVDGVEIELTITPVHGLVVGLNYTYLDSYMPLQPNPLDGGALKEFQVPLAPRHAGSMLVDYTFSLAGVGSVTAHMDITSTDQYSYVFHGKQRRDGYTLLNASLTLSEISIGQNTSALKLSIWGKNLTDEEYVIYSFAAGDPAISIAQAFGDPRTAGIAITYEL